MAKQYANATFTKHHYDLSSVVDYWPGVDMPNPVERFKYQVIDKDGNLVAESASDDWFDRLAPYLKKEVIARRDVRFIKVELP